MTTILGTGQILPDYVNYDLTATRTIGKWKVGLIAFSSSDLSKAPWSGLASHVVNGSPFDEQSQFAVGRLVGYAFTGVTVQLYATTDVVSSNYYNLSDGSKCYETKVWSRAVVPLWNPLCWNRSNSASAPIWSEISGRDARARDFAFI